MAWLGTLINDIMLSPFIGLGDAPGPANGNYVVDLVIGQLIEVNRKVS